MRYYVHFHAYGQGRGPVSEDELLGTYGNDPNKFLQSMCGVGPEAERDLATGRWAV